MHWKIGGVKNSGQEKYDSKFDEFVKKGFHLCELFRLRLRGLSLLRHVLVVDSFTGILKDFHDFFDALLFTQLLELPGAFRDEA